MKRALLTVLLLFAVSLNIFAQDLTGDWFGVLDIQGTKLNLVFHIEKQESGYAATMDSPDQGAKGIPTSSVTYENQVLTIEAKNLGMKFTGNYLGDAKTIKGTFNQGTVNIPLTLQHDKPVLKAQLRSQDPREFPYRHEEVRFENKVAHVTLAGALSIPRDGKVCQCGCELY